MRLGSYSLPRDFLKNIRKRTASVIGDGSPNSRSKTKQFSGRFSGRIAAFMGKHEHLQMVIGWTLLRIRKNRLRCAIADSPEAMELLAINLDARNTATFKMGTDLLPWIEHPPGTIPSMDGTNSATPTIAADLTDNGNIATCSTWAMAPAMALLHPGTQAAGLIAAQQVMDHAIENPMILDEMILLRDGQHPLGLFNMEDRDDPRIRSIMRTARRVAHRRKHGPLG